MTTAHEARGLTRRDFMLATATAVAGAGGLGAPAFARAAEAGAISLPEAKADGGGSVGAALKQRRSIRTFAAVPLTLAEIAQLCWAAQGVTSPDGHRTTPSARAVFPLELYVAAGVVTGLAPGLYHYRPAGHALELVAPGDKRADLDQKAVAQPWNPIARAPAVFVIAGNTGKMAGSDDPLVKERAVQFTWAEAGLAAQGFFLQATALGLGSVYTGGFRPQETRTVLGLPAAEEVMALLPVGRRA